jgi:hypothetical protein
MSTTTIPKRSPWGAVDHHVVIAPGIISVSTPSHGGIKLDRARNAKIHPAFRTAGGWYEEDCEADIAVFTFPDEFITHVRSQGRDAAQFEREAVSKNLRRWFPEEWEAMTGEKVTAEQSRIVADREFLAAHANDWVAVAALGTPEGVEVVCKKGGDRSSDDKAVFLVPSDEYQAGRFFTDGTQYPRIDDTATI